MVVVRSVRPLLHVRRVSVVVGWLVCLVALWALPAWGQMPSFFRQPKGSLLIVGGGDTPLQVVQRFVALAGGAEKARIAVLSGWASVRRWWTSGRRMPMRTAR